MLHILNNMVYALHLLCPRPHTVEALSDDARLTSV